MLIDKWGEIVLVIAYSSIIVLVTQFGQGSYIIKKNKLFYSDLILIQKHSK